MIKTFWPIFGLLISVQATAADLRIPAEITRVYDGDSFFIKATIWPQHTIETEIRVRGVDTPEIKGKCESEKAAAIKARDFVQSLGTHVTLSDIAPDKYGQRYDATVTLPDGRNLADVIIETGLGRPYNGDKRAGWC